MEVRILTRMMNHPCLLSGQHYNPSPRKTQMNKVYDNINLTLLPKQHVSVYPSSIHLQTINHYRVT
jgi:hypothetical protein